MTKFLVIDSEGNGLAYTCTKLHNLCWTEDGEEFGYTTDYDKMRDVLSQEDVLFVGHNIIRHDSVVFSRILNLHIPYQKFVDTLALSWFLYPDRSEHGLASWGANFGFHKTKVENHQWAEGDEALMRERVERDVLINWMLWEKMKKRLSEIYE